MSSQPDFYRLLFETAGEAILVMRNGQTEAVWTIIDSNASAETLLDCPREKLLGQSLVDFTPVIQPDGSNSRLVWQEKIEATCTGQKQSFEWQLQSLHGDLFNARVGLNGLSYGQELLIQVVVQDITPYKQREAALRQSELRYRALFDHANDAIFVENEADEIVDVNRRACEMLGYSREELLRLKVPDLQAPEVRGQTGSVVASEQHQHAGTTFEGIDLHRDGAPIYVEVSNAKVPGESGLYLSIVRDITARKQAEEQLRRLSRAVEQSANTIVITDIKGYIEYVNPKFTETTGYTREEALGQHTRILKSGGTTSEEYKGLWETITAGQEWRGEFQNKKKNGELYWELASISPIKDEQGNITHFLAVKEEITERKRAETSLARERQLLRTLIDNVPDYIFVKDTDGRFMIANKAVARLMDAASPEELIGQSDFDFYPEEVAAQYYADEQEIIRSGQPLIDREERGIDPAGREIWHSISKVPLRDEHSQVIGLVGIGRDVTERKQAEVIRQEAERRLADIIDFLPTPTFVIDLEGNVIAWNQAIAEVTGVKAEDILGKGNYEYALPFFGERRPLLIDLVFEPEEEVIKKYINVRREGTSLVAENRVFPKGIERYYLLSAAPLYDAHGNLVGAIETFRDITEQKQLEQQIQESLHRRDRQMRLSIEVAREIAMATVEEDLYSRVVSSVLQQLDYTHAQLFRYQSGDPTARIVAGDAEVGSRMLAEGYQVPVSHGSVGAAIATGTPALRPVVTADEARQGHPLLSKIRSELAVPIKVGGENVEAQAKGLNFFLEQKFDGLVVYPIDLAAVRPLARQAVKQGMKVVALHADMGGDGQTALIQLRDREMGYQLGIEAGTWAREHVPAGETLQVGILNYRANPQVTEREAGIIEGIEAAFEGKIEIVAAEFATDPGQGMSVAERWLKSYPNLSMIVAINDGGALGAYRAVIAANKNDPNNFFVGGIDATDEALAAIRYGGAFQATVDIKPQATGVLVVRMLAAAIKGRAYPATSSIPPKVVNRANLETFLKDRQETVALPDAAALEDMLAGLELAGIKLGLSVLDLDNPYFAALVWGAGQEAARLGIELVVNDPKQVIGALVVQNDTAGTLDVEDELVMEGLAAQLATAFTSLRLLEEANTFRQFAEASGQGFGMATLAGEIVYANPALLRLLDEEKLADVVGKPIPAYYSAEMQQRIQTEVMPAVLETGQWLGEMTLKSARGRLTSTWENYFVIRNEQGQPHYIADVLTDITDRKQAETELENRLNELHTLQRLMSREGWQEYQATRRQTDSGYLFDQTEVRPMARTELALPGNDQQRIEPPADQAGGSRVVISPLAVAGESIGALGVYDNPAQPLSAEDQAFLEVVAAQVAEALERARLLEQSQNSLVQTEEQARRLALLTELSRELAETTTIEEAFTAVVSQVVNIVGGDRASIALVKPDTGQFEVHALSGLEGVVPSGAVLPVDGTAVGRAILENRVVIVTEAGASDYLDARHLAAQGIRSTINAPLATSGQAIGTVNVGSMTPNTYSEQDERLMVQVTSLLASTIENRRLFEQTQAALAEVEATQRRYTVQAWEAYRAKRATATSYEQSREGVLPLSEAELAELARIRPLTDRLSVRLSAHAEGSPKPVDGGPPVLQGGQPDAPAASLVVPLTVRDTVIGLLGLQATAERDWTPEEVALVEAIAEQVAQAAENLRLFDETQQRAARERRVGEIGDKIRAAQSLEEALQVAIKEVGLSLKAPQTTVQLAVE